MINRKKTWLTKGRWLLLLVVIQLSGCQVRKETTPPPSPAPSPSPTSTPVKTPEKPPQTTQTPQNSPIGQATTKIFDNIPERNTNLKLAIQAIDQTLIQPGEEFSFNETVGDRTKEKGYREAIGFDEHGEKKPTVGGGICQISSTLYMAAKNGGFEITERHSHSHKVPYADSDNDATVSYGGYDFKFKNNQDKPIVICIFTDGETVVAQLIPEN